MCMWVYCVSNRGKVDRDDQCHAPLPSPLVLFSLVRIYILIMLLHALFLKEIPRSDNN